MKTYLNTKTGGRFPEHGSQSSFATWSNGRFEHHIKPGTPECTKGWKKVGKEWNAETIPDLEKPFTREQWIAYADQYGDACAMEFLDCCDYSKPLFAYQLRNPPKGEKEWNEARAWFQSVFRWPLDRFIDGTLWAFGNRFSFDVLKFEKFLASHFEYKPNGGQSIRDFLTEKFSAETSNKIADLLKP